jgi:feruloyl esterase
VGTCLLVLVLFGGRSSSTIAAGQPAQTPAPEAPASTVSRFVDDWKRPDGPLGNGWRLAHDDHPTWWDRLELHGGVPVNPDPDKGPIAKANNSGARGAAYRDFGPDYANDFTIGTRWNGKHHAVGCAVACINLDDPDWGLAFCYEPNIVGGVYVLWALGRRPDQIRVVKAAGDPKGKKHVDGEPMLLEMRVTGNVVTCLADGREILTSPIPPALVGSTTHGFVIDVNPVPDRPPHVEVISGPFHLARPRKPVLKPAEIQRLRLPDVRITSVAERGAAGAESRADDRRGTDAAHMEVQGVIGGTIRFELLLPVEWNGRFVMGGGGGFVGSVTNFARGSINEGYATAGTDTGHQWPSTMTAGWALDNVEAQVNFGHLAVHRTAEVAKALIAACYGSEPDYSYFIGCSTGGGQALMEAQRYPDDFDGIVSAAPVVQHTGLAAARVYNAQRFFPDPKSLDKPLISNQLLQRLHAEVLRTCDEQDGVKDGLLDDPRQCRFDLSQFAALTPVQRRAIQAVYEGPRNEKGQIYPGMPLGVENQWFLWASGSMPAILAQDRAPNPGFSLGVDFCKYFIFNDPAWDYSTYDFSTWEKDAHLARTFVDADNPDLSRFKAGGKKLILWHGWSDGPLTPLASINYFEEVERRDPQVRDYFRLYLLPGVMHCAGGPGPDRVDWLAVVRRWVEEGIAPCRLIASKLDKDGKAIMTRPIYPYPLRAVYNGRGDINDAASFTLPGAKDAR